MPKQCQQCLRARILHRNFPLARLRDRLLRGSCRSPAPCCPRPRPAHAPCGLPKRRLSVCMTKCKWDAARACGKAGALRGEGEGRKGAMLSCAARGYICISGRDCLCVCHSSRMHPRCVRHSLLPTIKALANLPSFGCCMCSVCRSHTHRVQLIALDCGPELQRLREEVVAKYVFLGASFHVFHRRFCLCFALEVCYCAVFSESMPSHRSPPTPVCI